MNSNSSPPLTSARLLRTGYLSITAQDELQLKVAAQNGGGDQTIRIEGGLRLCPARTSIWARTYVNGTNGHVIEHAANDSVNGTNVTPSPPQTESDQATTLVNNANTS